MFFRSQQSFPFPDLTNVPDFVDVTMHPIFIGIRLIVLGPSLDIVRAVRLAARSFFTRLRALHRYQATN